MKQIFIDESFGNPWHLRKVVLPQHTDHAGVMWHGSYLEWLEEARIEALVQAGISYGDLSSQGYEMPVVSLSIDYKTALFHGDEVLLKSWIMPKKGPRWPWKTIFYKKETIKVAQAEIDLVLIEKTNNKNVLLRNEPKHLSKIFLDLQKGSIV